MIINFYLTKWNDLGRPGPVPEPMFGTGLNLIPYLEAGAHADGLDSSEYTLEVFRERCELVGFKPQLFKQYIEHMDLPRQYGHVMIPGGSFGHIYDNAIAVQCLKKGCGTFAE